jgi:hypothetical protein
MEEILKQLIIDQNESQVDELLKNENIDVNAMFLLEGSDKEVYFPILHYAIFVKNVNIIKSLIKYGIDVNLRNTLGSSPLNMAIDTLNEDIALLLIDAGADWNIVDNEGLDFFDRLTTKSRNIIIEKYPEKYKQYLIKKEANKYNL